MCRRLVRGENRSSVLQALAEQTAAAASLERALAERTAAAASLKRRLAERTAAAGGGGGGTQTGDATTTELQRQTPEEAGAAKKQRHLARAEAPLKVREHKKLCVLALAQVALPGCLLVWMFVVRVFGESAASVCVPVPVSVSVPAPCGVRARAAGRAGARGLKADGSWLLRQAAYKVRVRVKKQV